MEREDLWEENDGEELEAEIMRADPLNSRTH